MRVLFIGNSFTSVNNLPVVFQQLAAGAGKPVVVGDHSPGGATVGDTAQGTYAHMNNPQVYSLIKSRNWDYLVLQDNQGRFVNNYGIFPGSSKVIEGHKMIRDSLLYYHPCAKMIWFAGWGPKAGYPPYSSTGKGLIEKIYANYLYLYGVAGQVIAPIGPAWERIISSYTNINLWDADDVHPGINGTALTADVVYATIFKTSARQSTYTPAGISLGTDTILKNTGFQTVMDSLNYSGLLAITPTIVKGGNTLSITGYPICRWYLNGTFLMSTSGILHITQPGTYYAILFDATNCMYRSLDYVVSDITFISKYAPSESELNIFPNPASVSITISSSRVITEFQLINALGHEVLRGKGNGSEIEADVSLLPKGIYVMKVIDPVYGMRTKKIILQ
ncbi:MAG: SGNH/GDSL hydrolase family protein [bacterium]|nr:SGNH/GDSL hydrolase family protein [bacterium]